MNKIPTVAAQNLLYREFPEYFVWSSRTKKWTTRKRLTCIGRLVSVHIADVERFYLRLLLNHVRASISSEDLRTNNGNLFSSFHEAALDRGSLAYDNDVRSAMEEAASYQMPYQLRHFFAVVLVYNSPSDPKKLWEEFKEALSSDVLQDYAWDHLTAYNLSLKSVDSILRSMGHGINEYSMVELNIGLSPEERNTLEFSSEMNSCIEEADLYSVGHLNEEQQIAFNEFLGSLSKTTGSTFFIDGPGGTGKTYLYRALLATVRSKGGIALAVASSGVAASLLPNGRTAHSRFKIPLKLDESMCCSMSKNSVEAKLIIATKMILWDEASMANRKAVEAFDLLLQDLMGKKLLFGGKTVVLGGDFR